MLSNIIRNFFVILISIYSFYKLLNINFMNLKTKLSIFLFSLIISSFASFLFTTNLSFNWLFIFVSFFLFMKCHTKLKTSIIYITALFSFALSFFTFNLTAITALLVTLPFYYEKYDIPWILIRISAGILQFLLIYSCFCIPRLRNGMSFLYHIPLGNLASTLCISLLILIIMFCQAKTFAESFILVLSSLLLISGFIFLYWWNYHLTQIYRKYIQKSELASLEMLLLEKNNEIAYYKNEHEQLSSLVHKDNKIIPALTMAVTDFLENADKHSNAELKQLGASLQTQLRLLYDEHMTFLDNSEQKSMPITSTDFASVNGVLMFMRKKATDMGIEFQFLFSHPLAAAVPSSISEKEFLHLLSDLLDNAIIAAGTSPSGSIQIHMGMFDKIYTLKVTNTGNPFPIEVLQYLGISRHTTHKDSGGTGIGLIDIWKIKEACSATLLIDEITASSSGTASTTINILFNKKRHFIIHTDRYKKLAHSLNRPDVMILPKE